MTSSSRTLQAIIEQARTLSEADRLEYSGTLIPMHSSTTVQWNDCIPAKTSWSWRRKQPPRSGIQGERIGAYQLVRSLDEGGMGPAELTG